MEKLSELIAEFIDARERCADSENPKHHEALSEAAKALDA
jgi:hypothetical protein